MARKRYGTNIAAAALALLLGGAAGCGSGGDPETFNDQVALANKRLGKAAWEFRDKLSPLSQSPAQPANVNAVKGAYDKLKNVVNEIREERKNARRPSAASAEELHKAYDAFLESQARLVDNEFSLIVRFVENPSLPSETKWKEIQGVISAIQAKENGELKKLTDAQQKFASDVSMKLAQTR